MTPKYDRDLAAEAYAKLGSRPKVMKVCFGPEGIMFVWPGGSVTFETAAEAAGFLDAFRKLAGGGKR